MVKLTIKPVSSGIYRKIFTEDFNLGFYKPKKKTNVRNVKNMSS